MKTIDFQVTSFFIWRIKAKSQNLCNRHDRFDIYNRTRFWLQRYLRINAIKHHFFIKNMRLPWPSYKFENAPMYVQHSCMAGAKHVVYRKQMKNTDDWFCFLNLCVFVFTSIICQTLIDLSYSCPTPMLKILTKRMK